MHAQLHETLRGQRRHVLAAIDGLDDEQLRRATLPSGWTALGMVRHLTLSDERYWIRCVMGGESTDYFPDGDNADWQVGPGESAETVLAEYAAEVERSDALIATLDLDTPPAAPDPQWATWGLSFPDLATVLLHLITEVGAHAGHLDAHCELIDSRQWVVL